MGLFDFLKKKKVEQNTEESELFIENNELDTEVLTSEEEVSNIELDEQTNDVKQNLLLNNEVEEEVIHNFDNEKKENSVFDGIKKDLEEIANNDATKTIEDIQILNKDFDDNVKEEQEEQEELIINENIVFQSEVIKISDDEGNNKNKNKNNNGLSVNDDAININTISTEVDESFNIEEQEEVKKVSIFDKFKKGLNKTKESILGNLDNVLGSFTKIDEELFEELEESLIMADLGVETSVEIIEKLRERVKKERVTEVTEVKSLIIKIISEILEKNSEPLILEPPTIILVIGVNGVGKTTTIGKLTHKIIKSGKTVQLAAADTFRAAAIDQLQIWADRNNVNLIKQQENSDPGAVVFDAVKSAKARKTDVLIVDTAGRLHNKKNLMDELSKINRIIKREYGEANLEVFLTLDSTTGQNAMQQAKQFNEVTNITGLVLTKLDGTAKGGIVVSIKNELDVPVRFIGIGEKIDDLEPFDSNMFASALFE